MENKENTDFDARSYLLGYCDGREQRKCKVKETCKWSTEGDPYITIWHETNCGESFYSDSGDYKEIGFKWCPYCGLKIEEDNDESSQKNMRRMQEGF